MKEWVESWPWGILQCRLWGEPCGRWECGGLGLDKKDLGAVWLDMCPWGWDGDIRMGADHPWESYGNFGLQRQGSDCALPDGTCRELWGKWDGGESGVLLKGVPPQSSAFQGKKPSRNRLWSFPLEQKPRGILEKTKGNLIPGSSVRGAPQGGI